MFYFTGHLLTKKGYKLLDLANQISTKYNHGGGYGSYGDYNGVYDSYDGGYDVGYDERGGGYDYGGKVDYNKLIFVYFCGFSICSLSLITIIHECSHNLTRPAAPDRLLPSSSQLPQTPDL